MKRHDGSSMWLAAFYALVVMAPAAAQTAAPIAFVNVNVVPMDENQVLRNHTVVVHGDRIVDVGPAGSVDVPDGAMRIDGRGKYLMPGLSEMHGHTAGANATDEFKRQVMFLYAANGVTTVRGMLGIPGDLELKALTNSGTIWGPTLYLAGPSFNGNTISSPEQAVQRVWDQKREGWDHLKVHPGLTMAEYDAMARTAADAGIRFGGHVPEEVGVRHAITMGQVTFDHLDGYIAYLDGFDRPIRDRARMNEIIELTRKARAWVVPTMVLWEVGVIGLGNTEDLSSYPEMKYWPPNQVEAWANRHRQLQASPNFDAEIGALHARNRVQLLKAMSDGGVGILMGTDSPQMFSVPGFSLHREMAAMADAGMSPYEILVTGTRNVGEYFQAYDTFGTVAVGRRADFILTNANPLEDVANVADRAGVMVRGVWKSEAEIQQGLAEIAASFGN